MTRAAPLLLLAVGCNAFVGHTGKADVGQHDQDSGSCGACDEAARAAGEGMADARCVAPNASVVTEPWDIEVKLELNTTAASHWGRGVQPVVADMDGDGMPEVAVIDFPGGDYTGTLSVFDHTGAERLSRPASSVDKTLMFADVDGGDGAELIATICEIYDPEQGGYPCANERLAALRADGSEAWGIEWEWPHTWRYQAASVGDPGDGALLVYGGEWRDLATGAHAVGEADGELQFVSAAFADADGDGVMEIATEGALFDAEGNEQWHAPEGWTNAYAVALQADEDPLPELLFLDGGWFLADSDGSELATVYLANRRNDGTPPALADFTGDGTPELAFGGNGGLGVTVYSLDGEEVWSDPSSEPETLGGYDFDGDGSVELVTIEYVDNDHDLLRIRDGRTGVEHVQLTIANVDLWPPFAADLDNDGHAELLIPGGVPRDEGTTPIATILHQVNDTWPAAGPAWPTRDFQVSNIGPAGEIPRGETNPPAWSYSVFHARPAVDADGVDLAPSVPDVCIDTCAGTATVQVQVTNTGAALSTAAALQIRAGDTVLAEATTPAVSPGATSDGFVFTLDAASFDLGELTVVVDPDGVIEECDEADNSVVIADPR